MVWKLPTHDRIARGVSPVVGVVLMIAVTILLAAAISTFALGIGGGPGVAPQVDWSFHWDGEETLTVRHAGGESINGGDVRLESTALSESEYLDSNGNTIHVGDDRTFTLSDPARGETVRLIWDPDDEDGSILAEWDLS